MGSEMCIRDSYRFLNDGSLIWWSERDGYGHLYRFAAGEWTQLTKGVSPVTALVGVDEEKGRVYFQAVHDVLEKHIYYVDMAHLGANPIVSELGYVNSASMDKNGQSLLITRSSSTQPPQTYLADTDGNRIAWVEENALDADHPYAPYLASHVAPEFGTVPAEDGTPLHYMMLKPDMEPGKKYPCLLYTSPSPRDLSTSRMPSSA